MAHKSARKGKEMTNARSEIGRQDFLSSVHFPKDFSPRLQTFCQVFDIGLPRSYIGFIWLSSFQAKVIARQLKLLLCLLSYVDSQIP